MGVNWKHEDAGKYTGFGEHAYYEVHKLTAGRSGWMSFRRLGPNPLKSVGGPYKTAKEAQDRAEQLEASL